MNIITLTISPAFDRHCHIADFAAGHEFAACDTEMDAGGKGVNISRALTVNGVENEAVVVVGCDNAAAFCEQLDAVGMTYRTVTVSGRIRENLTIHTDSGEETRIAFQGFSVDKTVLDRAWELVQPSVNADTVVTITGRMPNGAQMDDLQTLIANLKAQGARVVIDSRSFTKDDLINAKPWLIKPNQEEISMYLGRPIHGFDEALAGAKELCSVGIEHVMVSLGEQGAMLVTAATVYVATAPQVTVKSTVGAGDSSIAGFLTAMSKGQALPECLARAVAFGSAACETKGTMPPLPDAVVRLMNDITVKIME